MLSPGFEPVFFPFHIQFDLSDADIHYATACCMRTWGIWQAIRPGYGCWATALANEVRAGGGWGALVGFEVG